MSQQQQYDNTNRGIISKNDRKTQDKHPDIKGSINVDGVEYWLDGWQKKRQSDGATFYSLSVKRKEGQAPAQQRQSSQPSPAKQDEEIPF
jgi:hypothetical protein